MKNSAHIFIACIISSVLFSCSGPKTKDLIPFSNGNDWGYADRNGNTVISKQFTGADFFTSEGLAPAADENGKWGFIDSTGKFVIQPEYDDAHRFSEGVACVKKGDNWGFISVIGEMIISHQYSYPGDFSQGFACVALGEVGAHSWGYIDKTGKALTTFEYSYALPFDEKGRAAVKGWNFINTKGESLCAENYEEDLSGSANEMFFSEGFARMKKDGLFGFINDSFKVAIPFTYDFAHNFSDGLAAVKVGEKYGYIDKSGKIVIEPAYTYAWIFGDGLAAVTNDQELSAYIDKTGKEVLPFTYTSASEFRNGAAIVKTADSDYYLIDKTGKKISKEYEMIFADKKGSGGLFEVWNGKSKGYIDATGKEFF